MIRLLVPGGIGVLIAARIGHADVVVRVRGWWGWIVVLGWCRWVGRRVCWPSRSRRLSVVGVGRGRRWRSRIVSLGLVMTWFEPDTHIVKAIPSGFATIVCAARCS